MNNPSFQVAASCKGDRHRHSRLSHLVMVIMIGLVTGLMLLSAATCFAVPPPVASGTGDFAVPVLLYHRFGTTVADSMTITTPVFESHLKYLKENGYTVIPLRRLIDFYQRKGPPPPPRSVVIVVDDGHRTVASDMSPLVRKYRVPVTLFIYPSAISNASYAMTWDQVRELKRTGLFDVQSHTYWHPNFRTERKRLAPPAYAAFVDMQLRKSRERLEREVGGPVDMIAWPFGIIGDDLLARAAAQGYVASFSIERRHCTPADQVNRLPRYLLVNADQGKRFAQLLDGTATLRASLAR